MLYNLVVHSDSGELMNGRSMKEIEVSWVKWAS